MSQQPGTATQKVPVPDRCQSCGSRDTRISYPRFYDYFLARFRHFEVFRCRACQYRFRVYLARDGRVDGKGC